MRWSQAGPSTNPTHENLHAFCNRSEPLVAICTKNSIMNTCTLGHCRTMRLGKCRGRTHVFCRARAWYVLCAFSGPVTCIDTDRGSRKPANGQAFASFLGAAAAAFELCWSRVCVHCWSACADWRGSWRRHALANLWLTVAFSAAADDLAAVSGHVRRRQGDQEGRASD